MSSDDIPAILIAIAVFAVLINGVLVVPVLLIRKLLLRVSISHRFRIFATLSIGIAATLLLTMVFVFNRSLEFSAPAHGPVANMVEEPLLEQLISDADQAFSDRRYGDAATTYYRALRAFESIEADFPEQARQERLIREELQVKIQLAQIGAAYRP